MAWALRSLCGPLLSAHLLTTSKLAVVWPAAIMRPLGETGPGRLPTGFGSAISFPLPVYTANATGGLGAVGHQQAVQGIYLCIACYYYQHIRRGVNVIRIGGILHSYHSTD